MKIIKAPFQPSTGTGGNSLSVHGTTESFLPRCDWGEYVVLGKTICFAGSGLYFVAGRTSSFADSYFVAERTRVWGESYFVAERTTSLGESYFVDGRTSSFAELGLALLREYVVAGRRGSLEDEGAEEESYLSAGKNSSLGAS